MIRQTARSLELRALRPITPTKHVTTKRAPCIRSWSILKQFSFDSVVVLPKFIKILFILISGNLETFYFLHFQKHFLLGMLKNWTTELQNEKWWMPHHRLLWLLVCVSSLCKYDLDWFLEEGRKKRFPLKKVCLMEEEEKGIKLWRHFPLSHLCLNLQIGCFSHCTRQQFT